MDKLLCNNKTLFDQPANNQDNSPHLSDGPSLATTKFNALYKNNDMLIRKQQQRRNEILSNRLSKRDKLMASLRRLVSDVASDEDESGGNGVGNLQSSNLSNAGSNNLSPTKDAIMVHQQLHHTAQMQRNASDIDRTFEEDSDGDSTLTDGCNSMATPSFVAGVNHRTSKQQQQQQLQQPQSKQVEDRKFRNKAMLSEWLVDRPMNFETDWVLKAMPVGRRCLVFARKGETVAYSRTGKFVKAFQSALPGGCYSHTSHCRRQFAIVDCIYVHQTDTFYMMDALAWNEHKLYESEASFRFFWLQSRYNENQDKFLIVNSKNESRFFCLQTYSATDQDILTALNNDPLIREHKLHLDGLLFFHVRGPYVPGANPLVLWIKPEMVHSVLKLPL